jgi:hypothetical protein
VLKQISLLPTSLFCKANSNETTLPVVGSKIADLLRQDSVENVVEKNTAEKPAVEKTPENVRRRGNIDFDPIPTPDLVRPSTRVFHKPGGPTHDIFGHGDAKQPVKTCVPIDPRRYETQVDLVNPVETNVTKVLPELISHMTSVGVAEDDEKPHSQRKHLPDPAIARVKVEGEEQVFRAGRKLMPGKELEEHEETVSHSGVRMVGSATYNTSHFSIGQSDQPEAPGSFRRKQTQRELYTESDSPLAKVDRAARGNESQWSHSSGQSPSSIHSTGKPSSRVLNVPGGPTSWSLA